MNALIFLRNSYGSPILEYLARLLMWHLLPELESHLTEKEGDFQTLFSS